MKYVLDTNAVSALMKGDAQVIGRLEQAGKNDVACPNLRWRRLHMESNGSPDRGAGTFSRRGSICYA